MRRTLTVAAVTIALSAAAFGQSDSQKPGKTEKELIAMSRAYVDADIGKDIVVVTDGLTLTPTGPMNVAEVKGRWDSVGLEAPVVRIRGDKAVVTGRVSFKGHFPDGRAINQVSGVRIRYVREKGSWKYVSLCLGACGPE
jgi:hypothetical protein